ncbi:MAG: hypothetical protein ACRYFS_26255 [Janthinobacterium lividum]
MASTETIDDMLLASNARYDEGLALLHAGYRDGGIYLLGYAAEMILKTSFCRVEPTVRLSIEVRSRFGVAEGHWTRMTGQPPTRDYEHNLRFWEYVLPLERSARRKPALGIMVSQTLSKCVQVVDANWAVKMRYQTGNATPQEAENVRDAVGWMRNNQRTLWS